MNVFINWLIGSVVILVTAYLLPGVMVEGFFAAFVAALVLGLINAILKPILVILTLPINVLTLGLFTLVINATMVMLAAYIVPGFAVAGFWWALVFAIILSLVNMVLPE